MTGASSQEADNHGFHPSDTTEPSVRVRRILGACFFLFGLINNVLYVVILSAALDLVSTVPKGLVLFCNIAPSLTAKVGWPYLLKGEIRYSKRIIGCCSLSFLGMILIASFDSLAMRLFGICCASFSCGLGEITFLQLITRYNPPSLMGHCVGFFSSGTGAAGLVGAGLWWILRRIGVRTGIIVCSLLPFALPLVWFMVLPTPPSLSTTAEQEVGAYDGYAAIPTTDEDDATTPAEVLFPKLKTSLSLQAKWQIVSPLLTKYMLPLFSVYLFEYIINQGVSPTLLYPVPSPESSALLSLLIKGLKDYYPFWQLVYQSFVFLSRSSITFGLPPLPIKFLALPALIQGAILATLTLEAARQVFTGYGPYLVFLFIAMEGICGGLAYVNVYYYIGHEELASPITSTETVESWPPERLAEWTRQAKEFRIGSMGFADSFGILLASLIAMPTEIGLCRLQVERGRMLCTQVG